MYGALPPSYPVATSALWMLHDAVLIKNHVADLPKATPCPAQCLDHYTTNDMYQPPLVSWIWHAYPYAALAANTWQEVYDPRGPGPWSLPPLMLTIPGPWIGDP